MYLAEAIREKEFISESIDWLSYRIKELSISIDDTDVKLNKELIKNKVIELENLYKDFQKYSIIISRAKVSANIKLNEDDFSIIDAEHILESMRCRLHYFESLLDESDISKRASQTFICIDLDGMDRKLHQLRSDIRTIENSIMRALWVIEV